MPNTFQNGQAYNSPKDGIDPSVGKHINDFAFIKKALIELQKKKHFTQLADTYTMPRHKGRIVKQYLWCPLLSDSNINDQGIDAAGVSLTKEVTIEIYTPEATASIHTAKYIVGEGVDDAAALAAAELRAVDLFKELGIFDTDYATTVAALTVAGWVIVDGNSGVPASGNLYGSSRDVAYISQRLPTVGEHGGRVNRVGFTRIELTASFEQQGFFDEYTKATSQFDEADFHMHVNREMIRGAHRMTEDNIQIDLLNNAGIVNFTGDAVSTATLSGETGSETELAYKDFVNLAIDLDNTDTPRDTRIITGSKMTDTRVLSSARILFAGSVLTTTLNNLADGFGKPALIRAVQYAEAGTLLNDEYGAIEGFRVVINPEMMSWEGAGADVTDNAGFYETGGKYDVFPLLCVGKESFTTIGFETSGTKHKFDIIHKKPSKETAGRHDPYGLNGFMSILWHYGMLVQRPERIGLIKTVARY